jgi:hypothetical protein
MSTLKIEAYSLFEFCQLVQNAILDGWKFDFDTNENFPTSFGSFLVAGMVAPTGKPFEGLPNEPSEAELVQETANPTRGRKPKVA